MPTPTIPNGSAQMAATTYTGTGSSQTITNTQNTYSFQPDFIWAKCRNVGHNNVLQDVVRGFGSGKNLNSNNTLSQGTDNDGFPTSANSTGFVANGGNGTNSNGNTYVAWQWKAGGAALTNTAGTITSTVSANTTAKFSVVTYTGRVGGGSWGHGLGVEPKFIIFKRYTAGQNWFVFSKVTGSWRYFEGLNNTNASIDYSSSMSASSTIVTLPNLVEYNTDTGSNYLAYCFADVAGYSAFGGYIGNGSSNGPFIYTGFRPRFVLVKASSTSENWAISDTSRSPFNAANAFLRPDEASAETTGAMIMDFNSNGFKMRNSDTKSNGGGITYVYMAFAENPFKYALAR